MTSGRTVNVRVWRPVHEAYRDLSNEANIMLSDLVSLVLLYAAFQEPLITYVLQEEFELNFEAARKYAKELKDRIIENLEVLEVVEGVPEEEIKA